MLRKFHFCKNSAEIAFRITIGAESRINFHKTYKNRSSKQKEKQHLQLKEKYFDYVFSTLTGETVNSSTEYDGNNKMKLTSVNKYHKAALKPTLKKRSGCSE